MVVLWTHRWIGEPKQWTALGRIIANMQLYEGCFCLLTVAVGPKVNCQTKTGVYIDTRHYSHPHRYWYRCFQLFCEFAACLRLVVWTCGHLHKCLVVVANLLNVHAELGINIGLNRTITMRIVSSTADKSSGILQSALIFQSGCSHSSMAMSSLQHAGELGKLELQW